MPHKRNPSDDSQSVPMVPITKPNVEGQTTPRLRRGMSQSEPKRPETRDTGVQQIALNVLQTERQTLIFGGFCLSLCGGWINSVTLASVLLQGATAHQTGNMARIALGLVGVPCDWNSMNCASGVNGHGWQERWNATYPVLCLLFCFFLGAILSGGLVEGDDKFRLGKGYGFVLLLESAVLIIGSAILAMAKTNAIALIGGCILALACGLQNAMASTWSGAVLRTTHITGVVTDIGSLIGSWVRGKFKHDASHIPVWKLSILVPLFAGFTCGSLIGVTLLDVIGYWSIAIPSGIVAILGIAYLVNHTVKENKARMDLYVEKPVEQPRITSPISPILPPPVLLTPLTRLETPEEPLSAQVEERIRQIESSLAEGRSFLPVTPSNTNVGSSFDLADNNLIRLQIDTQ